MGPARDGPGAGMRACAPARRPAAAPGRFVKVTPSESDCRAAESAEGCHPNAARETTVRRQKLKALIEGFALIRPDSSLAALPRAGAAHPSPPPPRPPDEFEGRGSRTYSPLCLEGRYGPAV